MKLHDPTEVQHLKVDALMFCHIYADLVCRLAKGVAKICLGYYLELLTVLQELQNVPECILDQNLRVFKSQKRLYSNDPAFNHRIRSKVFKNLCLAAMMKIVLYFSN